MGEKYYQEYGPISRRRAVGDLPHEEPPTEGEPPPDRELPLRRRLRRRRRRRRGSFFGLLLLVLIGAGGFLAFPYAQNILAGARALDGVSMQGQPIGGMGRDQVRALLEQRYGAFARSPVVITFEGHSWTPTLQQLGVSFDFDQMAAGALAAGHRGGPAERVEELWSIWRGGLDIAPRLKVDAGVLQAYLSSLALALEQAPRDAALSIAEGKVLPTGGQPGRQVLVDATTLDILHALQTLELQTVVLRTRTLEPTLGDAEIVQAIEDARMLLNGPLVLKGPASESEEAGAEIWTWEPNKIAELLSVEAEDGHMVVAVDPERLARAVERLAQLVDSPSVEPRVAFRKGKITITQPGVTGWRLKQPDAAAAISATLLLPTGTTAPTRTIELPVEALTPQVTAETLPGLGIVEPVGEGKSSFAGSAAYRITNIKAGAARLDGVLIAPDAEFSFNTQLGAVDEASGFVQGYAVIGNRTQLEWGGGVCQDSTTVFRAAFWAGLPITERHAHPFYISWYDAFSFPGDAGPGMDATIFTGVQDLKFTNDTGHWLLMEATADEDAQVLTVRLYGTKPDRTVVVKGPTIDNVVAPPSNPIYISDPSLPSGTVKQTDHSRQGMDIAVYRVITENGVQKPPEAFYTRFKAWPDVFVRGTGQ